MNDPEISAPRDNARLELRDGDDDPLIIREEDREPADEQAEADEAEASDQALELSEHDIPEASESEADTGPQPRVPGPKQGVDALTGRIRPKRELMRLGMLRPVLAARVLADHPQLEADALVSRAGVAKYRTRYVEELLRRERGELTDLEREVAQSLADHETLAEDVSAEFEEHRTIGERLSDQLASFGGSWSFLISFGAILIGWMALNLVLGAYAFDSYPFILLNLVLSCLAAVQAPIIMMSQRRQEEKDRLRSENDYRVNLKAELEIRHLHEKLDHLLSRQWERLAEIQQLQFEAMQDAMRRRKK